MPVIPPDSTNPDSPKEGRSPGRPCANVDEEKRKTVEQLSSWGIRQRQIASLIGIDPKTLRKHYRQQLNTGAAVADREVLHSLFDMATSRKNSAATIFWAKTRAGFTPKKRPNPAVKTPAPVRKSPGGFTVHLNDGAPNGEF
jgi:hypothetical protein